MSNLYGEISYSKVEPSERPILVVVIDTEEGFDWGMPHSREQVDVSAMGDLYRVQDIFDRYQIVPCYVIDYPVASQQAGYEYLRRVHQDGRCVIGAHLHPWVSPPHTEAVTRKNSFPGNLERSLEREKLSRLLDAIEESFDYRPITYKAGRYGIGPNSASILRELDLLIDLSPTPGFDYSSENGPDYRDYVNSPFWFGPSQNQLCIPCTGGYAGFLGKYSRAGYEFASKPMFQPFRALGILARLGAVERIRLSPEGFTLAEMVRISNFLIARGERILTLSFHSPSVTPGFTPYVENKRQLSIFLKTLQEYLEYFKSEHRGIFLDPISVRERLIRIRSHTGAADSGKHSLHSA